MSCANTKEVNYLKKTKWITFGIATILVILYAFTTSVNFNPLYPDSAFFYCVVISVYFALWLIFHFGTLTFGKKAESGAAFNYVPNGGKFPKKMLLIVAIPWIVYFLVMIGSSVIFNSGAYRDQLGEPKVMEFSDDVQPVDVSQLPIVDKDLASKLADKKLGERPSLGSQAVLGEPTIQKVNGKLVWAVPLHHSGFFKWLTNMGGTPGYIVVSATNVNDVQYVDEHYIKYQPDSYFFDDLLRHVRFTNAPLSGITDYSFEIDDDGNPYWVMTTYHNTWGFNLPEATGIILVNATTGEAKQYAIDEIPEWVDRVQPEDFIINQIDNQGEYVHGIFNFANKDKFTSSDGHIIIYNDDRCYLFTGLTSVGSDESSIGFMMVDMVTKEVHKYALPGATEESAMRSAEGKVQHLNYQASFPIILNMDGKPTYFMPLKDNAGLIKQYAFVSVTDYSIVGVGETQAAAAKNYEQTLRGAGITNDLPADGENKNVTGTVERIGQEFDGELLSYKIILKEHPQSLFVVPSDLSQELALTQPGDTVEIEYADSASGIQQATAFDNRMFDQKQDTGTPQETPSASE